MSVTITFPNHKISKPVKPGILVASGRTTGEIIGVFGACKPHSGSGPTIQGSNVAFYSSNGKPKPSNQRFHRWMIAFKGLTPGSSYDLSVTGVKVNGNSVLAQPVTFTVGAALEQPSRLFITQTFPAPDEDLTTDGVADDFVPYGELFDYPLGPVVMTGDNVGPILPLQTFGDYTVLNFWCAEFDSLDPDTYQLSASDTAPTPNTVSTASLTVDQP